MKKILILTLISLVLSLPSSARRVKGNVECEGRCLSGVIVTDGCNFTTTRKDGSFVLNAGRDARFIYIVTPSGYTPDYSTGAPQFYLPLEGTGKFCFSLSKTTEQEDFTIFSVSDPQMGNKKHLARFSGKPLGDLRGLARKYSEVRPTVGIALGDIAWNDTKMFADYKSVILTTNIPFYSVIGNHDYIQDQDGPAAAKAFEDAFGPCNWAFFLGNDLIVGLNNIKFAASGKEKPTLSSYNYSSGYTAEAISFLRGLMKYAGKGSHIFIAQHSPIKRESGALIEGGEEIVQILEGYNVDFLSGHTHTKNISHVSQGMSEHNAAAIGGAWWATNLCTDGTPRGYEVISSVGGNLSFRWHNIDYPDDYQVEFTGLNKSPRHRNSVVACAWEADDNWTCTWTEDGCEKGPLERVYDQSASYTEQILAVYKGAAEKIPGYKKPSSKRHYYVATPSQYASKVTMTVTAPDGRVWEHVFDLSEPYIDLQAHRGGAGLMPENTVSSIRNAIDLNVNTLEFDLQLSGDGQVVVSHDNYFHPRYSMRPDSTLVHKEDPKEYLYTMPYDSIARYDVGLRPVDRWPDQKKVPEHKPLARDLIQFAEDYSREKGQSPVRYNVEIKSRSGKGEGKLWPEYKEFCDKCMDVLLAMNLGDRLTVQSFDTRALEYIHAKYPQVALSYLTVERDKEISDILSNLSFMPKWWSPHYSVVTSQNVAYCHALGIKVVPWTVDNTEDITHMVKCGVDAIISNYPDLLVAICRE